MSDHLLKFLEKAARQPQKRTAKSRKLDFNEVSKGFTQQECVDQSSRCSQCGVPFCQIHCPLQNNIPDWLMMAAEGRWRQAYDLSAQTNNFPEICGRICPQDRLCEKNCVLEQSSLGAVSIGAIEKCITDRAWSEGWVAPRKPKQNISKKVGIIGSGPAGLAAAEELRALGYEVHVYERSDRPGGLLTYGIPNFKLDKKIVFRRIDLLKKAGVFFHLRFEVGRDEPFQIFRDRHDAVLIAVGATKARTSQIVTTDHKKVIKAMDFLEASNRLGLGSQASEVPPGVLHAKDQRVVVIGGGDTAMDCVRTAVRQNARAVTCLYRRDRDNVPGSFRELQNAEEEGVYFEWLSSPVKYQVQESEIKVLSLRNRLSLALEEGRKKPLPIPGSEFETSADLVIEALGFEVEDINDLFQVPIVPGREELFTNIPGVFWAGDIYRGPSLVVWAIRDGQQVANKMHNFLQEKATKHHEVMA